MSSSLSAIHWALRCRPVSPLPLCACLVSSVRQGASQGDAPSRVLAPGARGSWMGWEEHRQSESEPLGAVCSSTASRLWAQEQVVCSLRWFPCAHLQLERRSPHDSCGGRQADTWGAPFGASHQVVVFVFNVSSSPCQ